MSRHWRQAVIYSLLVLFTLFAVTPLYAALSLGEEINQLGDVLYSLRRQKQSPFSYPIDKVRPGLFFIADKESMKTHIIDLEGSGVDDFAVIEEVKPLWESTSSVKWFSVKHLDSGDTASIPADIISRLSINPYAAPTLKRGDTAVFRYNRGQAKAGQVAKITSSYAYVTGHGIVYYATVNFITYQESRSAFIGYEATLPYYFLEAPTKINADSMYAKLRQYHNTLTEKPLRVVRPDILKWVNLQFKTKKDTFVSLDYGGENLRFLQIGRAIIDHADFQKANFAERVKFLIDYTSAIFEPDKYNLADIKNPKSKFCFSDLISKGRAVCQEYAEWLGLLLVEAGYAPTFRGSRAGNDIGHAWIEVENNGKIYLVDIGNDIFAEKESLRTHAHKEATNWYFDLSLIPWDFPIRPPNLAMCAALLVRNVVERFTR